MSILRANQSDKPQDLIDKAQKQIKVLQWSVIAILQQQETPDLVVAGLDEFFQEPFELLESALTQLKA